MAILERQTDWRTQAADLLAGIADRVRGKNSAQARLGVNIGDVLNLAWRFKRK